jgi:hypothetical protein
MGLLRRHSGAPDRREFVILVESSAPWPAEYGSLAVQWQRGKRGGQTKPAPPAAAGALAAYAWGEALVVPATLYADAARGGGALESKPLQLFVSRVDAAGRELEVLAALDLDLAELAELQAAGPARRACELECAPAVRAAVGGGRPRLALALGAARAGGGAALAAAMAAAAGPPPPARTPDGGGPLPASLSTDEEDEGPAGEDEVAAIERAYREREAAAEAAASAAAAAAASAATAAAASAATAAAARPAPAPAAPASDGSLSPMSLPPTSPGRGASAGGDAEVRRALAPALASPAERADAPAGAAAARAETPSPPPAAGGAATPASRRFARDGADGGAARRWSWRRAGAGESPGEGGEAAAPRAAAPSPAASLTSLGAPLGGGSGAAVRGSGRAASALSADGAAGADAELAVAAALESAVFLAGSGAGARALQAPARRLARTLLALGPAGGPAFGAAALAAVRAAVAASLGDPARLALWWSTVLTLRWSGWALARGGGAGAWLAPALGGELATLERALFEALVELLWSSALVRAAGESAAAAAAAGGAPDGGDGAAGGAAAHWAAGLRAADAALAGAGRPPAAPRALAALLRRLALAALLDRLDAALLAALLTPPGGARPPLSPALAPAPPGAPLTFDAAARLKMAAAALGGWAADVGLRPGDADVGNNAAPAGRPPRSPAARASPPPAGAGAAAFFPRLRAAADLLMMPKAPLADAAVRAEVAPGLPPAAVAALLARFEPDAGGEAAPPALLRALRAEAAAAQAGGGAGGAGGAPPFAYAPPAEAALETRGLVEPLALEAGDESDEELAALEAGAGVGGRRFRLLRELWAGARAGSGRACAY